MSDSDYIDYLESEVKRLSDLHHRNVLQARYPRYNDHGHHCGWRVIAESMAERSKQAMDHDSDYIETEELLDHLRKSCGEQAVANALVWVKQLKEQDEQTADKG